MPPRTGVKVKLDKQRTLRYTTRALMALESETGKTFSEAATDMQRGSLTSIVTLVWAGLLHESPELAVDDVADLIDNADLQAVAEAMSDALTAHLGADEGKAKAQSKAKD